MLVRQRLRLEVQVIYVEQPYSSIYMNALDNYQKLSLTILENYLDYRS